MFELIPVPLLFPRDISDSYGAGTVTLSWLSPIGTTQHPYASNHTSTSLFLHLQKCLWTGGAPVDSLPVPGSARSAKQNAAGWLLTTVKSPQCRWPPAGHSRPPAESQRKPGQWCLLARPAQSRCSQRCCCTQLDNWEWWSPHFGPAVSRHTRHPLQGAQERESCERLSKRREI